MRDWFNNLQKREQWIVLAGAVLVVFYLIYGVFYRGLAAEHHRYQQLVERNQATLNWMQGAVATLQQAKRSGGVSSNAAGKSLSQLSELAAKRAQVRISRFQPSGDDEAQVWLDKVEFDQLLDFLLRLEQDYSLVVDNLSVNTANSPGVVNARLKFTR